MFFQAINYILNFKVQILFPWRNNSLWDRTSSLSRLHDHTQLDKQHSVGLLWTSDQPDAVNSDNTTSARNRHAYSGIRTHNPTTRTVADPQLRPHGHRDRRQSQSTNQN